MTQTKVEEFLQSNRGAWFSAAQIKEKVDCNTNVILRRMTSHPHYRERIDVKYDSMINLNGHAVMCKRYKWIGE